MTVRSRTATFAAAAAGVLAAAGLAACGSGSGSSASPSSGYGSAAASQPATAPASTGAAIVRTASSPLGTHLVDARGDTLYLFEKDRGTASACTGACAAAWPPAVTAGAPRSAGAAKAGDLGTAARADGQLQVTYAGHPLYTFSGDTRPGQAAGQASDAFGAEWYVLAPSGTKIEKR